MANALGSLRGLIDGLIGDDDVAMPVVPAHWPDMIKAAAAQGIAATGDYQDAGYATLYLDRVARFVGRHGLTDAMQAEIAYILSDRMTYLDPVRVADLKLRELGLAPGASGRSRDVRKFRLEDIISTLPSAAAGPVTSVLERMTRLNLRVPLDFSGRGWLGLRKLKLWMLLKRWRLATPRYPKEKAAIERWLHMIDRSLVKCPAATEEIVHTGAMVSGYGDVYRTNLAGWLMLTNGLVKPVFDGALRIDDLPSAIASARAAALADPTGLSLRRLIAEIAMAESGSVRHAAMANTKNA
jgi:hypothetical protein